RLPPLCGAPAVCRSRAKLLLNRQLPGYVFFSVAEASWSGRLCKDEPLSQTYKSFKELIQGYVRLVRLWVNPVPKPITFMSSSTHIKARTRRARETQGERWSALSPNGRRRSLERSAWRGPPWPAVSVHSSSLMALHLGKFALLLWSKRLEERCIRFCL